MKVKTVKKDNSLAEIGQHLEMRFSFCNFDGEVVTRIHEMVKCRDFLGDVVYANRYNTKTSIYGFNVNPEVQKIKEETTTLFVSFPTEESYQFFKQNVDKIFAPICAKNSLKSNEYVFDDAEQQVVVTADKAWQSTVMLISLFTFLLKVAAHKINDTGKWWTEISTLTTNEGTYTTRVLPKIEILLSKVKDIYEKSKESVTGFENEKEQSIYVTHNSCGFVALAGFNKTDNIFSQLIWG